ncbi:hypothetical protein M378DRAFT_338231 [Amanita muscaria Koide BX008]|uniref:Uncharacterized protein n=1 Tax=Amanita muscaria (strain Koide BX008) TaxID=946122 RepID=A0A0C2SVQ7_AMAMK|nr:hypothetical protein M378DRAFT_338231 [Amanita muscaria Koide BX008]
MQMLPIYYFRFDSFQKLLELLFGSLILFSDHEGSLMIHKLIALATDRLSCMDAGKSFTAEQPQKCHVLMSSTEMLKHSCDTRRQDSVFRNSDFQIWKALVRRQERLFGEVRTRGHLLLFHCRRIPEVELGLTQCQFLVSAARVSINSGF